ncbi:hypothetical protein [Micromonospora aurantiaca (nom. illeg.)]|uniref:hypothetical protein n=1 Tax=Micromonospora aurantiaca (nom. illeg.) TaxID=47850 RepID=UPI0033CBEECA
MTSHRTNRRMRIPGLPDSYPAQVTHHHGQVVVRLAWTTLVRLAADLLRRWPHQATTGVLAPVICLHDGQAHLIRRFGDRDTSVVPLLADADGLYRLDDPSLPWIVAAPPAPATPR